MIQKDAYNWQVKVFPKADNFDRFRKLCEEVGELGEALGRKDGEKIAEELGDVQFVLMTIAESLDLDLTDLVNEALEKNRDRISGN